MENSNKKKITILMPIYNDWKSLNKLLKKIEDEFKNIKKKLSILIIDDCSKKIQKIDNFNKKKIKIIKLKKNIGNQKAIFHGLKYLYNINFRGNIVVMDSDGEDDPLKIKNLIRQLARNKNNFIVAARKSRTENIIFRLLNNLRLIITYFLTGKYINFGNFSCFNSSNLKKIIHNNSNNFAYCSIIAKNKITKVFIDKKKRYFEKSKASYKFLFLHSVNILTEFSSTVIIRSLIFIFMFSFFRDLIFVNFLIVGVLIFNAIILLNLVYNNYFKK